MEYNRIVAVTGLPGLFEILSSKNDGALVRSLADNTTKFVTSRVHNMSHLESIEVYTIRENVNLAEVFQAMQASGEALPNVKDNAALKAYFQKVFPDLDFERVYASDMKKMVKWFEVLGEAKVEIKAVAAEEEAIETENVVEPVAVVAETPAEEKPKAKRAPRKKKTEEDNTEEA
ncbi:hypothetical protein SAMN05444008_11745 [Cnuella takakiae]|uniref:Uncharacterized protein n=1 Tax=Cnuella takakiae TaxID=1302690 RepID=A0A1M5GT23_9BACT|nr:DUF5606 domain-containing protein [Cnuella takakiae]OLY90900.1 hypothetical protein BUE76_02560 [Cnuella takakiae]SHG06821.1 hypothetical protein SAMN05444008_11745 [Cnuella takakiae]